MRFSSLRFFFRSLLCHIHSVHIVVTQFSIIFENIMRMQTKKKSFQFDTIIYLAPSSLNELTPNALIWISMRIFLLLLWIQNANNAFMSLRCVSVFPFWSDVTAVDGFWKMQRTLTHKTSEQTVEISAKGISACPRSKSRKFFRMKIFQIFKVLLLHFALHLHLKLWEFEDPWCVAYIAGYCDRANSNSWKIDVAREL